MIPTLIRTTPATGALFLRYKWTEKMLYRIWLWTRSSARVEKSIFQEEIDVGMYKWYDHLVISPRYLRANRNKNIWEDEICTNSIMLIVTDKKAVIKMFWLNIYFYVTTYHCNKRHILTWDSLIPLDSSKRELSFRV